MYPPKALFRCYRIHLNPHVLGGLGWNLVQVLLQHIWIDAKPTMSKQGLKCERDGSIAQAHEVLATTHDHHGGTHKAV